MRYVSVALLASVLCSLTGSVKAHERPTALIAQYDKADQQCRGGSGDSPKTMAACDRREKIGKLFKTTGWCVGKIYQATAEYKWHECGPGSLTMDGNIFKTTAKNVSYNPSNNIERLIGTWRDVAYKTCKTSKNADHNLTFDGSRFKSDELESDCTVLNHKNTSNGVALNLWCKSEGEESESKTVIKFIDDDTIQFDAGRYKRCN